MIMLRRLLFFNLMFLLFIAGLPFSLAQADCDFSYSNYARAVQLQDMGDYVRALKHYHCAQLEDPDDAIIPILIESVYDDIATASTAWTRPDTAKDATACDSAIDHAQFGAQAHDAGDDSLALMHLHCVLLADSTHIDALYRMGMIHINRGETHEAKHFFDRADRAAAALAEDEDLLIHLLGEDARSVLDEDALINLPLTSPEPGETGEYLPPGRHYERTVLTVIWTRQGQVHDQARQADNRDPIADLERALEQDPTRVDLRCELGRRYLAQGDYAGAYAQFSYLVRERLDNYCSGASQGDSLAPPIQRPTEELQRALRQQPTRVDLRCELGRRSMAQGDYAAAYSHYSYLIRERLGDHC